MLEGQKSVMERKECNAEGKTSACQITSFISAVLQNYHKKSIHIKCYYLQKRKSLFKNDFFKAS
jgi:hypothetical protein